MEGIIKEFKDEYTVVVEYVEQGKKKLEIMRIADSEGSQVKKNDRVAFNLTERDAYRRVICRVINKNENNWFL